MKNRDKYLLALLLLLTGIFLVGKIAFIIYNQDIQAVTFGQSLNILWHGILLDLHTSALLLIIPTLCALLMRRGIRWILVPYFFLMGFVMAATIMADIVMYEFWEFKLCAVHLSYAASPEGTTNSVSIKFLVTRALAVVAFLLMASVPAIWLTPKRFDGKHPIIMGLIILLLAVIPIRVGSCYLQGPLFLSHAATNPTFRFGISFYDTHRYSSGDYDEQLVTYSTSNEITDTLLTTQKPNVLLVLMESFGGNFVKELGGIPDVSPNISRLIPEGIFWEEYYSNSFRTDRGTVCMASGWMAYPTISPMKEVRMHESLSSLPKSFRKAGYQTGYMYGGAMTNMGKYRYLADAGFETLMDDTYFAAEEINSSWGANDSTTAMKMYKTIAEVDTAAHWMMVWQTLSSHEPWDVPYHRLEDKKLNAFAYTDHCLGQLVDSLKTLPVWDKLLVIIIPDHGFLYEQTYDTSDFFHSPMLWIGGAVKEPRHMSILMNQSDIAATLLAQMGLPHDNYPWSRNVLAPDYKPFVYCNYPAGLFYKDNTGETLYDLTARKAIPIGETTDPIRLKKAISILHYSYSRIPNL